MYYDYSKNTLSSEFNENSVADFYSKFIESGEKCIDLISDKLKNRVPFSLVRIGDVEARFLIRNKTIGDSTAAINSSDLGILFLSIPHHHSIYLW